MSVRVRRAVPGDAEGIAAAEVESWRAAYAGLMPAAYLDGLDAEAKAGVWRGDVQTHGATGRKRVWVAEDGGRIVGYSLAGISKSSPPGTGLLYFLYLVPAAWGSGVASELMAKVMGDFADQGVRTAYLWVLEENWRARRFYEKQGWAADGESSVEEYGGVALRGLRYRVEVGSDP